MDIIVKTTDGKIIDTENLTNFTLLSKIAQECGGLKNVIIENATFSKIGLAELLIENVRFINCVFDDVSFKCVGKFENTVFENCIIRGFDEWVNRKDLQFIKCKLNEAPSNEELENLTGGKIYSLPNKDYVKVQVECDFCHNTFFEIMSRKRPHKMLKEVPQSNRRVCDQCYRNYDLSSKIKGNRTYGWHGPLSFYRTPMDAKDTEILGLEMEFEGDFWDWKGLQDAHRGHLHYGYDSSVRGENELSWDCGSYSYWKYLAPLNDVCNALEKGGGSAGDSAGIHIHVSTPNSDVCEITKKINAYCKDGEFRTMMEAISLRSNKDKFNTYANLDEGPGAHHAGISYNGHGTCEFRVFNSTLNSRIILRHLKFCKEFYHAVKSNTPKTRIMESFSKETKKHIIACAKIQVEKGFITQEAMTKLIKKLGV